MSVEAHDHETAAGPAASPGTIVAPDKTPLLSVKGLVKHYPIRSNGLMRRQIGDVHAVCGVDIDVMPGQTVGLVGESGCGKTTTGRSILQLIRATAGSINFNGKELTTLRGDDLRKVRRELQVVFQDPYASLDPKVPVGETIAEPLRVHDLWNKRSGPKTVRDMLHQVGLDPSQANRYPNELSGGQRQRVGVARALILQPRMIVLDEPVSALDVSVQAGVVNLLEDLQEQMGLAYLFVAHDLSVVRHICERVAVMYLGKIVEVGNRADIYDHPAHPYTQALLSAVPIPDPQRERSRERIVLQGDVPSPASPPSGCRFRTRCWKAQDICAEEEPALIDRGQGHPVACHFAADDREVI